MSIREYEQLAMWIGVVVFWIAFYGKMPTLQIVAAVFTIICWADCLRRWRKER